MFAVLDFETERWTAEKRLIDFRFGVIQYYKDDKCIREDTVLNTDEAIDSLLFCRRVLNNNKSYRVYAHNLDYDIKFLMKYFVKRYKIDIIANQLLLSMKVRQHYYTPRTNQLKFRTLLEFRNSYTLLPMSLKKVGKIVGSYKGHYEDYDAVFNYDYWQYCKQDCHVVYLGLKTLCNLFSELGYPLEIDKLNLTTPAIAYKLFYHENKRFEYVGSKSRIESKLVNRNQIVDSEFREFYFGGRCEVFSCKIYAHIYYLDVNSLYPYIMISFLFPIPPYNRILGTFTETNIPKNCFALMCQIDESNSEIPLVVQKLSKNCYLAGKKRFLLTIEEYRYLIEKKQTPVKIDYIWTCESWEDIFSYMRRIYKIRKEKQAQDNPIEYLYKVLVMNATYGKFVERTQKVSTKIFPPELLDNIPKFNELTSKAVAFDIIDELIDGIKQQYIRIDTKTIQKYSKTNPVIGQRITALSRLTLYKYYDIMKENNLELIYSDTDSIVVNADKDLSCIAHLLDEEKLGFLKKEFEGYNFLAISPKEYLFMELKETIAGLNIFEYKQKAKGLNEGKLDDYANDGIEYVRPMKIKECMVRKMDFASSVIVPKKKSSWYDKRKINDDYSTSVIHFPDEIPSIIKKNEKLLREQLKNWNYVAH